MTKLWQDYSKYTAENHKAWALLYAEQMEYLPKAATEAFLRGTKAVRFTPDRIPVYDVINEELAKITGWQVYVVPGLIDNKPFFEHLANREFPVTTWIRQLEDLQYTPDPDLFHDVFGHVPLLSEPFFCEFLQALSEITLRHIDNPSIIEIMARLYWYTVEFGLIRENGNIKIYGAGIMSSPGESRYCLSSQATHVPFDVRTIMESPYNKDKFQDRYFVIESYEQLRDSLSAVQREVDRYVADDIFVKNSY